MISTMTATEIANKNKSLVDAEYCLKNLEKCAGVLTVVVQENAPETVVFGSIFEHDLKCVIESVIDNLKSRLDELNELAVEEAQNNERRRIYKR